MIIGGVAHLRRDWVDLGPLLLTWINFNPSMDLPSKMWDEITYQLLNFNSATV